MRDLDTANKVTLKLPDSLIAVKNRLIYCLHLYFYAVFCNTIWVLFLAVLEKQQTTYGDVYILYLGECVRKHHLQLVLNPVDRETMHVRNNLHRHPRWRQLGLPFGKALYQLQRHKMLGNCKIGCFFPSLFLPLFHLQFSVFHSLLKTWQLPKQKATVGKS